MLFSSSVLMKEFRKCVSALVEITSQCSGSFPILAVRDFCFVLFFLNVVVCYFCFVYPCMAGKEAGGYICARNCAKYFYFYCFILLSDSILFSDLLSS